jgi:hypothetical protein
MSETDTGVASCALDNSTTWTEETTLLSILDDVEGCTILHGAARVHELGLAEDLASCLIGDVIQANEGRISDR